MGKKSKNTTVKNTKTPIYISLGVLLFLIGMYFLIPGFRGFLHEAWDVLSSGDEERTREWVSRFGIYGPLLIIVGKILQLFAVVIPTIAMIVVAILAYGSLWGGIIAFIAVVIAANIAYFLGGYFGPALLDKIMGSKSQEMMVHLIEDYGFWGVGAIRINPILSGDAISFIAGSLKMSYLKFLGATITGAAPLIGFIAFIGRSNDTLINGLIWSSAFGIVGLVAFVWWDKKKNN